MTSPIEGESHQGAGRFREWPATAAEERTLTWKITTMTFTFSDPERAVLGAVILDNEVWLVAEVLRADNFSLDAHRRIFCRMRELAESGRPIDIITLGEELTRRHEVEAVGGIAYLTSLTDGLPRTLNIEHYVKMVREAAGKRYVSSACEAAMVHANGGASLTELAPRFAEINWRLAEYQSDSIHRIVTLDQIPDPFEISSGDVSWAVEGLIPARAITVLAGEPGAGKTWLAMGIVRAIAQGGEFLGRRCERRPVLYLDRENPLQLMRNRLQTICGGPGVFRPWGAWCEDEPPMIGDPRLLEFAKIGAFIVFDSLIRFHSAENENDASEMSKVMAHLRRLANAGATLFPVHHKGKSETSSYRGSSDIAGGADAVFALVKRKDLLELRSVKHRFTAETTISIQTDFAAGRFTVTDSSVANNRQKEIDAIAKIISSSPGLSKNQVVQRSGMGRNKVLALLDQHEGSVWKSRRGAKRALLYEPV